MTTRRTDLNLDNGALIVIDELTRLLAVNGFLPHGYCISWSPQLLWTFVISDVVIFLSYFSMPVAIGYFAYRRQDFPYRWLLWAFAACRRDGQPNEGRVQGIPHAGTRSGGIRGLH